MSNTCNWCQETSERIDSLEFQVEQLKGVLNYFVTEHCDRDGPDDEPVDADEQSCPIIRDAMRLLK